MDSAAATATRAQWQADRGCGMPHEEAAPAQSRHDANSAVACISARQLLDLVLDARAKPSPDARDVFPWLYGISPQNQTATSFLRFRYPDAELGALLAPPQASAGVLLVKFGDPEGLHPCIKGTIDIQDILATTPNEDGTRFVGRFVDTDMTEGLQLRNFAIQPAKFARICDIILYATAAPQPKDASDTTNTSGTTSASGTTNTGGIVESIDESIEENTDEDLDTDARLVKKGLVLARLIHDAQVEAGLDRRVYFFPGGLSTVLAELSPELRQSLIIEPEAQVDPFTLGARGDDGSGGSGSSGSSAAPPLNWENGLPLYEQDGIIGATAVSEVLPRMWLGNFISMARSEVAATEIASTETAATESAATAEQPALYWHTKVMCDVDVEPPTLSRLDGLIRHVRKRPRQQDESIYIMMPRISAFAPRANEMDSRAIATILSLLKFLYMRSEQHAAIILSPDGYHIASPYAALYVMYSTGMSLSEALLYLHDKCQRPLSFSPTELLATLELESVVYAFSPTRHNPRTRELGAVPAAAVAKLVEAADPGSVQAQAGPSAAWIDGFPGAFPSRILEHLYLGAFEHANNPEMLRALGISRIISVGEKLDWLEYPLREAEVQSRGFEAVRHIEDLQDDGVDSLLPHLPACLTFLAEGEQQGRRTLVHCRKGVSRSAAVCIAEVMRAKQWGLPQAYAHVRVRRLDVLIQPNLRLMYDLLKFEEQAPFLPGRTTDWPVLSREITRLNGEYDL